jgi:hypothetical protein
VVATHRQTGADVTIVTHSIEERDAGRRGVMRVNPDTGGPPTAAFCAPDVARSSLATRHRQVQCSLGTSPVSTPSSAEVATHWHTCDTVGSLSSKQDHGRFTA